MCCTQEDTLLVGGEGGKVHLYNVDTKQLVYEFDTKTNRSVNLSISRAHFRCTKEASEKACSEQLYTALMFPCIM